MKVDLDEISANNKFNIVDVLIMDHKYLKEGIKILKSDDADPRTKLKHAKTFLDALEKHSDAEKRAVYAPLIKVQDLKKDILEGQVEHGIADAKVRMLSVRLTGLRTLTDELEAELKVLAELIEHHIDEEEEEMFPKIRRDLDKTILNEMGFQFMKIRNFTAKDLRDYPKLQKEVTGLRKLGHRLSSNFISKVQDHLTKAAHGN